MSRSTLALVVMLAACGDPPPFALKFSVTGGDVEACPSSTGGRAATCSEVALPCDAYVSIRIVPPSDPTLPYISVCKPLSPRKDLCSIAAIDLPQPTVPIPEQTLEVQMVVFPKTGIQLDGDGNPLCPTDVQFSAQGFPVAAQQACADPTSGTCPAVPAIGGRAFYHPGDAETVVSLGCNDLAALQACGLTNTVAITATVDDFDTEVPVTPATADHLAVSVGEPKPVASEYMLSSLDSRPLERTVIQPVPGWGADVDLQFLSTACLAVLEDGAQSTTSLTCKAASTGTTRIDLAGVRLAKATLTQVLTALAAPQFPDKGLVVGMVLDDLGNPAPDILVTSTAGTVEYLSTDRHNIIAGGTSANGIFVSTDAAFGTVFSAQNSQLEVASGLGGLVNGKVTMVVLQLTPPQVGN